MGLGTIDQRVGGGHGIQGTLFSGIGCLFGWMLEVGLKVENLRTAYANG